MLRPVTLKPPAILRKVVYHNVMQVFNSRLSTGEYANQYVTINLNSPWMWDATHGGSGTAAGVAPAPGCSWIFNKTPASHQGSGDTNGYYNVGTGSSYPGIYTSGSHPGHQYREMCITGSKVTLVANPIVNPEADISQRAEQPTMFFAVQHTNSPHPPIDNGTIPETFHSIPYMQTRKILSGPHEHTPMPNPQPAKIVHMYSGKKTHHIANLTDNDDMWVFQRMEGDPTQGEVEWVGRAPIERDYLTFGIAPILDPLPTDAAAGTDAGPLTSLMIEMRIEATILFRDPRMPNIDQLGAGAFPGVLGNVAPIVPI